VLTYLNLETILGIDKVFSFDIVDDTGLPVDMTGYTFRFEVFDSNNFLKVAKTGPDSLSVGVVNFKVLAQDMANFIDSQYQYRLFLINTTGSTDIYYQGILNVDIPAYSDSLVSPGSMVLPDGSIYVTAPLILQFGVWYATLNFYRLLVSGIGTMTVDARDITGNIYGNQDTYQSLVLDTIQWLPNLTGMNAFRINQILGTNVVQYLP
jgi:hypothetical protein